MATGVVDAAGRRVCVVQLWCGGLGGGGGHGGGAGGQVIQGHVDVRVCLTAVVVAAADSWGGVA